MSDGYIRLWRKSIDSGWLKNKNVWIFWTWCLMKANHKISYKQVVGFQEVLLEPGQFVFGRKMASKETFLSEQNIRTCLTFLKKSRNLTIKSTNKFSIITVVNWSSYQYIEGETNQQSNKQLTSNQPASNHKQEQLNSLTVKEKKKRVKKKTIFIPPSQNDVIKYFLENGYKKETAIKAWKYYEDGEPKWHDSRGNKVKAWKQKMRGVWFKDKNKGTDKTKEQLLKEYSN